MNKHILSFLLLSLLSASHTTFCKKSHIHTAIDKHNAALAEAQKTLNKSTTKSHIKKGLTAAKAYATHLISAKQTHNVPSQGSAPSSPEEKLVMPGEITEKQSDEIAHSPLKNIEPTEEQIQEIQVYISYMLEGIKDATQHCVYMLEQMTRILNADKIKIHISPEKKAILLEHIHLLHTYLNEHYNTILCQKGSFEIPLDQLIYEGLFINHITLKFLEKYILGDITKLNVAKFQELQSDAEFKAFIAFNMEHQLQPEQLIMIHKQQAEYLIKNTDKIGLSTFNKWYRTGTESYLYKYAVPGVIATASATFLIGWILYGLDIDITNKLGLGWIKKFIGSSDGTLARPGDAETRPSSLTSILGQPDLPATTVAAPGVFSRMDRLAAILGISIFPPLIFDVRKYAWKHLQPSVSYMWQKTKKVMMAVNSHLRGDVHKKDTDPYGFETPKIYFKDMIGAEHLKKLAHEITEYLKHPDRYERAKVLPHRGILLEGPPQTGKSFFAKALRTLIDDEFGTGSECKFLSVTQDLLKRVSIEQIFTAAHRNAPCILFFDEIDMVGANRDKNPDATAQFLTCMSGIDSDYSRNQVIVIGATNRPEEIDDALLKDGRFGYRIPFDHPCYEFRKEALHKALNKRRVNLSADIIDFIAQETEGATYNTIDRIVSTALLQAMSETRPVTTLDFEESLDREFRHIMKNLRISDKEKQVIAIYQAAKALAYKLLDSSKSVVKITLYPVARKINTKAGFIVVQDKQDSDQAYERHQEREDPYNFGEVFVRSSSNSKTLISDEERNKECLILLAGQAALELILQTRYSEYAKHDQIALNEKITKIVACNSDLTDNMKDRILELKQELYEQAKSLMQEHIDLINTIVEKLLEKHTISRLEWQEIVQDVA